ncbi:MAG: hypothetical protein IPH72_07940 [Sandaracinaceae bacterium]|nr:hypothetical protein [Sandaracinaceae bacterium]
MTLGSEGTLGVITEAWVRVRPKPTQRSTATCLFKEWRDAVAAVRAISQSGLYPANCRLLDAREAALNLVNASTAAAVPIGVRGADHAFHAPMARHAFERWRTTAPRCPQGAKRSADAGKRAATKADPARGRRAFIDAPTC